jgi:predicted amidohydrolase
MTTSGESTLRVACLQMEPRIGDKAHNLKRTLEMIGDAASAGARLLVLPELCNTRCCATGAPTSTTRCSAPTSSGAGTSPRYSQNLHGG